MDKKQITFSPVPDLDDNTFALGSLVVDKTDTLGSLGIIDLRGKSPYELLARDFLAAFNKYSTPAQISSGGTVHVYQNSLHHLLEYCSLRQLPVTFRMQDIDYEFLLDFRSHIKLLPGFTTTSSRRKAFGNIQRILTTGIELGLADVNLRLPNNLRHIRDDAKTQPYSMGEALDIEAACREDIRSTITRLSKGKELLAKGRDPRGPAERDPVTKQYLPVPPLERRWNQLENLLWYVVNILKGKYIKYVAENGHSSFAGAVNGQFGGPYRRGDVYGHLYPFSKELIPFLILLGKTTGRNETSLLELNRDCLQEINGRYILWYRKRRGGDALYSRVIRNDGPFSPVALIQMLLEITKPLVEIAPPQHKNRLFIGITIHSPHDDFAKPPDPACFKNQMNQTGGWCEQNELIDENGNRLKISMRRLRVFYLSMKYKRTGQLAKISRDAGHSATDQTLDYIENRSTKHIHEQAIEDGLIDAYSLVKSKITTVVSAPEIAADLNIPLAQAISFVIGEQDVFFASCRDFYNRPNGPKNTACSKAWQCFDCGNSIITRHVLPRVVAFRQFAEKQKDLLHPIDWTEKFGRIVHQIDVGVLPKFSEAARQEAENRASNEQFFIPLHFRT